MKKGSHLQSSAGGSPYYLISSALNGVRSCDALFNIGITANFLLALQIRSEVDRGDIDRFLRDVSAASSSVYYFPQKQFTSDLETSCDFLP